MIVTGRHWFVVVLILCACAIQVDADDRVYQEPSAFIRSAFSGRLPQTSVMKLDAAAKKRVKRIIGHKYAKGRIRYWAEGSRAVWILEEIGKTKPITTGLLVEKGILKKTKVLIYRESHGWEVSKPFFLKQFTNARLGKNDSLSNEVKNVAGATLSVKAVTRLSRLALYLDTLR